MEDTLNSKIEERFKKELAHHLEGWRQKVAMDFNEKAFEKALKDLEGDAVYKDFHFASPEYVLVRLMGRMSISIGRRLGEIYDKIPRFVVQARYNLKPEDVAPKFGKLELDIQIPLKKISDEDKEHVRNLTEKVSLPLAENGLGIEIRYNFNPNDSSRLRKDEDMARKVMEHQLTPIYLVFSTISPRDEAIARLKRAGWHFLVGQEAYDFMTELANLDITNILSQPGIKQEINDQVNKLMSEIYHSYAFKKVLEKYYTNLE